MNLEGKRVGRFLVNRTLGSGGMGVVYEATDTFLGRSVALKVLSSMSSDFNDALERFFREARAVARLEHKNIVRIYEADDNPQLPYIAMELIRGQDGRAFMSERPSLAKAMDVLSQIFDGLHHAHQAGVVHRDVKPANFLITDDGTVKLIDFGLARLTDDSRDLTRGQVFGSAPYMSPEQIMDPGSVDFRTDIYMGGVLLYQLIAGELPFHGATVADTLTSIVKNPPPDLLVRAPHVPSGIAAITMQCLEKQRVNRPHSAGEVAERLRAMRDILDHPDTPTATVQATPFMPVSRHEPVLPPLSTPVASRGYSSRPAQGMELPLSPQAPLPENFSRDAVETESDRLSSFDLTRGPGMGADQPPDPGFGRQTASSVLTRHPLLTGVLAGLVLLALVAGLTFGIRRFLHQEDLAPLASETPGAAPGGVTPAPLPSAPVTVTHPPTPESIPALKLLPLAPPAGTLRMRMRAGETYEFKVHPSGGTGSGVTLDWRLNDEKVATGSTYKYTASQAGFSDLVSVTYSDPGLGQAKTLIWYVNVD